MKKMLKKKLMNKMQEKTVHTSNSSFSGGIRSTLLGQHRQYLE